jgi:hypothetical protein
MVPGVDPLTGEALSQVAELVVVAVKLKAAPLLLTAMLWAAGAVPPVCAVNDRVVGLTTRLGRAAAVTVNVTVTVRGLLAAPVLATETVPV